MELGSATKFVWIVVRVESGVPVFAESFLDEDTALKRESEYRLFMNSENDEVGVFTVRV